MKLSTPWNDPFTVHHAVKIGEMVVGDCLLCTGMMVEDVWKSIFTTSISIRLSLWNQRNFCTVNSNQRGAVIINLISIFILHYLAILSLFLCVLVVSISCTFSNCLLPPAHPLVISCCRNFPPKESLPLSL